MEKPILLTTFCGEPQFERLPVYKLCCDPVVPVNDRVFAQAQLCKNETHLFARIWTFETHPAADTLLSAQFTTGGHLLAATASLGSEASLVADGVPLRGKLTSYLFSGEDLQGVYAGALLQIPLETFFAALAADPTNLPTKQIGVNLLRQGRFVSSLMPVGQWRSLVVTK